MNLDKIKTFVFDVNGTLEINPFLAEDEAKAMIEDMQKCGYRVVIWSTVAVPYTWNNLVQESYVKFRDDFEKELNDTFVVFDDDDWQLEAFSRLGAHAVNSNELGLWFKTKPWRKNIKNV